MADYDRRPRRGGGQPFNNRKRRYHDEEHDDRRPQRRRYEEPLSSQFRKQVLSIAENPVRRVDEDIANIAKTVAENYFDSDLTSAFLDLIVRMTVEQPLKIPFVAAAVLHTNAQKPEFTSEVLKTLKDALQKNVNLGDWREVKLFLRFMACLQGLFEGEGIFTVLEEIFSRAADLQMESSEDSLGLELVEVILLTIPYTMASSARGFEAQANALLDKTDVVASTPHLLETLVDPFPPTEAGASASQESELSLLQKHMQEEAKTGWRLPCLPRPWQTTSETDEENLLTIAEKHQFPEIEIPTRPQVGPRPIFPSIYTSVYAGQDIETSPPASDPSALLIRDALSDAIDVVDFNRSVAARFLIDMDCYFAAGTFVKRATPFDKLRDTAGTQSTWKPEDVIVDATFALLFQLPQPQHKLVYYHCVLTEACKLAPAAVAPSLGRAIRYLYRNIDQMDMELSQRFLDWFAHHLSNFGFTWKWTEWVEDVELPDVHPKKAFIMDALDKETRLSFAQRIRGTLPEPYHALISTEKEKDTPDFVYDPETHPFSAQAKEVAQKIRQRATDEELAPVLEKIEQRALDLGYVQFNASYPKVVTIDILMTSICWVGSKSLSHALAIIERYRGVLTNMANELPECRKQIATSVSEYWQHQRGTAVFLLDKLLNYQILTPASVVEWLMIDQVKQGTTLSRTWSFELISRITTKIVGRVKQVVAKIRDPKLTDEERATLTPVLEKELEVTRVTFAAIENAAARVAEGDASDDQLIRVWGLKWVRVFRRRIAVVESWVKEELARPLPVPEPELGSTKEAVMQDVATGIAGEAANGHNGTKADGGMIE